MADNAPKPQPASALAELVRCLQLAYSGELGAARAYVAHAHCLRGKPERAMVLRILRDEIRHRSQILGMLQALGAAPDSRAEQRMNRVGRGIAWVCRLGGWFIPMYGAAKLEADNIVEYEIAARLAYWADRREWCSALLELAEVEWDHERELRAAAQGHWAWRLVPHWKLPEPRASIAARFESFLQEPHPVQRRRSILLR